jgi:hypothetical protein
MSGTVKSSVRDDLIVTDDELLKAKAFGSACGGGRRRWAEEQSLHHILKSFSYMTRSIQPPSGLSQVQKDIFNVKVAGNSINLLETFVDSDSMSGEFCH